MDPRLRGAGRLRSGRWLGQHSLRSHKLAANLVGRAEISASDLVIEVGAGNGILTTELARHARGVIAVELDPTQAVTLIKTFSGRENVLIVAGDFLHLALPAERFRTFGNIPFGATTAFLRRLLDLSPSGLWRADLVVEHAVAVKRAGYRGGNLLNLGWAPWWRFRMGTPLPARCFSPPPSVDAAMLTIEQRKEPLLPEQERPAYIEFLRACFGASEIRAAVKPFVSDRRFTRLAVELGIVPGTPPPALTTDQWVDLYRVLKQR
ncbi:MAG: rRNA adenine N(6)-methyltransferase family protein [Actinomycetota bacterium]|nr:rRNA adenine N(6)-methyltransferase family protein [Actinomycetota bacterium]